jgi:site-specific recombinase XerD
MDDIKTSGGRSKLPIDPDRIVWAKHATGQYVGFRKTGDDFGTWWARVRDPATGKQHYKQLGEFADHQQAKRYDQAVKAALEWFRQADMGVVPHKLTVKDVCDAHVKAIRRDNAKKADRTASDFRRLIESDALGSIELGKLKRADLEEWRNRMASAPAKLGRGDRVKTTPRTAATINRDIVPLRAALNRALDNGLIASDLPWRVALRPIKNADRRRDIYLDRAQRSALLEKAGAGIKPFLKALSLLPLRPGALAALTAGDYSPKLKTLRIGTDKAGSERRITLPKPTADFVAELAKGKLPAAPLLATADGGHWTKDRWKRPIRDAVKAAKLPAAATAYALRHSVITDLVTGGLDLLTIAQISGTSVAMIEKHYGHLRQDHAAAALAKLAL